MESLNPSASRPGCLSVQKLTVAAGGVCVLREVSLEVERGELVAVLGSNGAGKTTLLRTVSGLLHPTIGRIILDSHDLTGRDPSEVVVAGLVYVPEGRQLFDGLSVRDNLMMGAYARADRREVIRDLERMWSLFPELAMRKRQLAGTLSGGEQQMCAIGRGLMSAPKMLLLDEVSLGLAPLVVARAMDLIRSVHVDENIGVLLVEQDIQLALEVAARGYVMQSGHIVRCGSSEELLRDPGIREAYLGI